MIRILLDGIGGAVVIGWLIGLTVLLASCAHKPTEPTFTRRIPPGIGDGPVNPQVFCRDHRGGLVKIENGKAFCRSGSVLNVATGEVE